MRMANIRSHPRHDRYVLNRLAQGNILLRETYRNHHRTLYYISYHYISLHAFQRFENMGRWCMKRVMKSHPGSEAWLHIAAASSTNTRRRGKPHLCSAVLEAKKEQFSWDFHGMFMGFSWEFAINNPDFHNVCGIFCHEHRRDCSQGFDWDVTEISPIEKKDFMELSWDLPLVYRLIYFEDCGVLKGCVK